jgi:hypothetical protein
METSPQAQKFAQQFVTIEGRHIRELFALIADRIDQDPGDIIVDWQTGQILGALSDAARAARYAIAQRIVLKGGEDPGWGR